MSILRNGKSQDELRQEQREEQRHNQNLKSAAAHQAQQDELDQAAYIDKMTGHQLEQGTVDLLSNLLDQDFMLGNLDDAEVHEYRWLARVIRLQVEAMHPTQDAILQGKLRAAAFDDRDQKLPPLSERDKVIIEQFIMAVIARATRGKSGWQQEMFNKTIQASETRQVTDDEDGGSLL